MISASCGWLLSFDNLSGVSDGLSDALCRLATGGALSTRKYYSDNSERLFQATRSVLLNGIDVNISRSDLLDRALILTLPPIAPASRRSESEFWPAFEAVLPGVIGTIFTAVSGALRRLAEVRLPELPRMADFATWVPAAEEELGWARGTLLAAYYRNRAVINELALERSVLALPIEKLVATGPWTRTATELLAALQREAQDDAATSARGWPSDGWGLSIMLHRLEPNLRAAGFDIEYGQTPGSGSKKLITLKRSA